MKECKHRVAEVEPHWWKCDSDRIFVKRNGLMHDGICLGDCPHADQPNMGGEKALTQLSLPPQQTYGVGTELTAIFAKLGVQSCQQCHALAQQMNVWGPEYCLSHIDEIVERIFEHAKNRGTLTKLAAATVPGLVKREIEKRVREAIRLTYARIL